MTKNPLFRNAFRAFLCLAVFSSQTPFSSAEDAATGTLATSSGTGSETAAPEVVSTVPTESWALVQTDDSFPKWLKETYDSFNEASKAAQLPSGKARDYAKELEFSNATFVSDALGGFDTGYWFARAEEYLGTKTDAKSAEYLAFIKENEWFFRIVMYGIKRKEYNNPARNPWNNQGQFQLYKLEGFAKAQRCDSDPYLYNSCETVLDLYKAGKLLTDDENLLQYLDFVGFVMGKFRGFDPFYSGSGQFSARTQTAIFFAALGIKADAADVESLLSGYNFRTRAFVPDEKAVALYARNSEKFRSLMLPDVQSLGKIPELTFWNVLGIIYNGTGNAGQQGKFGKFVWDNGYPCNNQDAGFRFFQIRCDGCTEVALQAGLGSTVWALKSASDVAGYDFHLNSLTLLREKLAKLSK